MTYNCKNVVDATVRNYLKYPIHESNRFVHSDGDIIIIIIIIGFLL